MRRNDKALTALLRHHGFRMAGDTLISVGVRGFTSDRILGRFKRGIREAAEWLIPMADKAFRADFRALMDREAKRAAA